MRLFRFLGGCEFCDGVELVFVGFFGGLEDGVVEPGMVAQLLHVYAGLCVDVQTAFED